MLSKNQNDLVAICAQALFGKKAELNNPNYSEIIKEAISQAVLPLVESVVNERYNNAHANAMRIVSRNVNIECAHYELYDLLSSNGIFCVLFKGIASASYYKERPLRTMGDIDFLVKESDIEKADDLLCSANYVTKEYIDSGDNHISYKKTTGNNVIVCEMHRAINGIPNDEKGKIINKYLDNIFDTAIEYRTANGSCLVPDKFHHGLILLLHTASHLTSEGIGLRHLCDWAVFVNSLSNDEFVKLFEKPLKEMGLWRFAQLLTLCCIRYLGCDHKNWAGEADDKLIEAIVADILDGGNFGFKDDDRYRQIKYIKNRNDSTVDGKKSLFQVFYTINSKAKSECKFVKKHKWLLPIGWGVVVFNYIWLVLSRKRKPDSFSTIDRANARKKIYGEFHLYETE